MEKVRMGSLQGATLRWLPTVYRNGVSTLSRPHYPRPGSGPLVKQANALAVTAAVDMRLRIRGIAQCQIFLTWLRRSAPRHLRAQLVSYVLTGLFAVGLLSGELMQSDQRCD